MKTKIEELKLAAEQLEISCSTCKHRDVNDGIGYCNIDNKYHAEEEFCSCWRDENEL